MISERLKNETLQAHKAVEKSLNFARNTEDKSHYLELLKVFYGFYLPLEKLLSIFNDKFSELGISLKERSKINLLLQDMKELGLSSEKVHGLKIASQLPSVNSFPEALGVLYVLEGSTLGGQVITKKLKDKNILGENEITFHNPYGKQTMPLWISFKNALNTVEEKNFETVIKSAEETFRKLTDWLNTNLSN